MVTVSAAKADAIQVHLGAVTYVVDPTNLKIDARTANGDVLSVMPPLHATQNVTVASDGDGWRWSDSEGQTFRLSTEDNALRLRVSGRNGTRLSWKLPKAITGTWLIPDGEGMAYDADDPFWRHDFRRERCLGGTTSLSFPAWSYLTAKTAVTYALGDGFLSHLCVRDDGGLQASLTHDFADGAETLDLLFAVEPPELLAPARFYRKLLKERGEFKSFADKEVPNLHRLFGAPHAYVWSTGHSLAFLDDLKALGITRIVLTYSASPVTPEATLRNFFNKAYALGYLAGPYDAFTNGQPAATADDPTSRWSGALYPWGCIRERNGQVMPGFGNRGCEMSSEALVRHHPFAPAVRYAQHVADGASEVFVDVDAFGEFHDYYSPDHPMTKARDRENRLARLGMAITKFHLVLGSEKVTAWSAPITHFSHGTAQAHMSAVWHLLREKKFGGWWPAGRPALFFRPFTPTADEARALFGPADRLPLFEAVFHDSVVAVDRWEFGLMKLTGQERIRFAHSLLYGTPTMWNLDRQELARVGIWLKAAEDDFRSAHGINTPVALNGFRWLTPDRLVQQVTYADGRDIIANFGQDPWQGLQSDCVRVSWRYRPPFDLCPPPEPAPLKQ